MKRKLNRVFFALMFLAGLSVLLYPFVANRWNTYRQSKLITTYTQTLMESQEEIDYSEEWAKAEKYNFELEPMILPDSFAKALADDEDSEYMTCLNLNGDSIMGIVEIPKINVRLPIYHTTTAEVLENGAGHLAGSSLPIGGTSGHSVISAHRGLPSAALFTDLDKLEIGDHFLLRVLDAIMCYEVDQINVVDPDQTELLGLKKGEDLVTLLTCTPYGVNTQRLLVRGHRVPYEPEIVEEEEKQVVFSIRTNYGLWVIIGIAVTGLFILILFIRERRLRRKVMALKAQKRKEEAKKRSARPDTLNNRN